MVSLTTLCRVCQRTILLVAGLNISQQWSLGLGISNPKPFSTLEHQVLQIVCQASSLGRVVL